MWLPGAVTVSGKYFTMIEFLDEETCVRNVVGLRVQLWPFDAWGYVLGHNESGLISPPSDENNRLTRAQSNFISAGGYSVRKKHK